MVIACLVTVLSVHFMKQHWEKLRPYGLGKIVQYEAPGDSTLGKVGCASRHSIKHVGMGLSLSVYLWIYLSISVLHQSDYQSNCVYVYISIYRPVYLSTYLSVYLSRPAILRPRS